MRAMIFSGLVLAIAAATPASAQDGAMVGLHELRKERGMLCMSDHWHSGVSGSGHKTRKAAMAAAIKSWSEFTALEYGGHWGNWNRAGDKGADCTEVGGSWTCDIQGRPCRRFIRGR